MSRERSPAVARAVFARHITRLFKSPGLLVPVVALPLLFFVAFAGALSAVANVPDFGYPDYTAFQFVFVLFIATSFAGVFTGFALVEDLQSGFARRLMLAAPRRMAIVGGLLLASLLQAVCVSLILFGIAVAAGMEVSGGILQVLGAFGLAFLFNVAVTFFAAGLGLRMQSSEAGPLIMMPVFMLLFIAPVFVPRNLLKGWLGTAADFNPLTFMLEAGRGFMVDEPESVAAAFLCAFGLVALFFVFALTGLRRAEAGT